MPGVHVMQDSKGNWYEVPCDCPVDLLREFDAYASAGGMGYIGSPFEARVRAVLDREDES